MGKDTLTVRCLLHEYGLHRFNEGTSVARNATRRARFDAEKATEAEHALVAEVERLIRDRKVKP